MKIHFNIEIRMYAAEQIMERVLTEDFDTSEWLEMSVVEPLRKNRLCEMEYDFSEKTTIGDAANAIYERITDGKDNYLTIPDDVTFVSAEFRYYVEDREAPFSSLVDKYFDPHHTGNVSVQVLVCMDEGEVCTEDGIRYYMKSRERGRHHEAHVHVYVIGESDEASIAISDGRTLAGDMRKKYLKRAKAKILSNQKFFYECWNAMTDGLRVDIDKALGITNY